MSGIGLAVGVMFFLVLVSLVVSIVAIIQSSSKASSTQFNSAIVGIQPANGFSQGSILNQEVAINTSIQGVLKGQNGSLALATPTDITSYTLDGFVPKTGPVGPTDTLLSSLEKIVGGGGELGTANPLTGLVPGTGIIVANDTILSGFGKLKGTSFYAYTTSNSAGTTVSITPIFVNINVPFWQVSSVLPAGAFSLDTTTGILTYNGADTRELNIEGSLSLITATANNQFVFGLRQSGSVNLIVGGNPNKLVLVVGERQTFRFQYFGPVANGDTFRLAGSSQDLTNTGTTVSYTFFDATWNVQNIGF
jgi:hypothetical protein